MHEHIIVGLAAILFFAVSSQWLAWRLKVPSILILLGTGLLVGPFLHLIHPDRLLGDLLFPVVSLSVAIILFEGGLSLKVSELREIGGAVSRLMTAAVIITWVLVAWAAHAVVGLSLTTSIIYGAILVVTGPTVIIPLLQQVRPARRVGSLARWEGIVNDPVGAILAVLVLEAVLIGGFPQAFGAEFVAILKTLLSALLLGVAGAAVLVLLMKNFLIPDHLDEVITLMVVVVAFTVANMIQAESGLLVVTILGIILANQKYVPVRHIITFKENLSVLLISGLFIILAARLQLDDLAQIGWREAAFVLLLIFAVRPLAIYLSTWRSELDWREKLFLSFLAPRGIVAAAVASLFSFTLVDAGYADAGRLIPLTFFVIICTVAFYGIIAAPLARRLQLAKRNPQGVLFVSAHSWAREAALALQREGLEVLLVDTNYGNLSAARMQGLTTWHGSILAEEVTEELPLFGVGKLLAMTGNDEVNAMAAQRFAELFGRAETYQLSCLGKRTGGQSNMAMEQCGRLLFSAEADYGALNADVAAGAKIKRTALTQEFGFKEFQELYGDKALPLFLITEEKKLQVFTTDRPLQPKPGQFLISLVRDTAVLEERTQS
ncbi:MAG TPA: cation:proton antiporter [bacterium]|nr:cation:proton antiporter [bacterium]